MQEGDSANLPFKPLPLLPIPKEFVCGGAASLINVVLVFPLHKTVFFQQLDGITWTSSFRRLQKEGFHRLYRGVLPPLLQRVASSSVMFGFQSQAEKFLFCNPKTTLLPLPTITMLSALLAGCLETILTPFERVQTLLQTPKYAHTYKNTSHALSVLLKCHGLRELYRGFTPILLRNCTGDVFYFCGKSWLNDKIHPNELPFCKRRLVDFLIGGLLGSTIGALIFPLSVLKSRMQSTVGTEFTSIRRTVAILVNEGGSIRISRLYSGLPANFARALLSWGIITMTYEWLLSL
ncbi:unnamed protein product [Schistocephalus solidus]|uniref:Solute carrier family 25 member 51 n=1 Tax=Schistocephalus solidus TaxID=70667 RepID=A0A183SZ47_SCHSO|nr:unnamed protein product [Schistocephalus solidus]